MCPTRKERERPIPAADLRRPRRSAIRARLTTCLLSIALLATLAGCRSTNRNEDSTIRRDADAGREAFAEGYDAKAIKRYRAAVKRSWALDDPYEISRNTYNLAAVLMSVGRYDEARDWLYEARDEALRLGKSDAHIRLLEAKVARRQGFPYDATQITQTVALATHADAMLPRCSRCLSALGPKDEKGCCECPHCGAIHVGHHVFHEPVEYCKKKQRGCNRHSKRREKRAYEAVSEVQVHLMRANLAADENRLEAADEEWEEARRKVRWVKDEAVHAEVERVAGRLSMLRMMPRAAAARFDREAELLRQAAHYREIPFALISAGEAYEMVELIAVAGNRYYRAARTLYGRDDLAGAALLIDRTVVLAELSGDVELQGRLAILFKELVEAFEALPDRDRDLEGDRPESLPMPPVDSSDEIRPEQSFNDSPADLLPPTNAPDNGPRSLSPPNGQEEVPAAILRFRGPPANGPAFPQPPFPWRARPADGRTGRTPTEPQNPAERAAPAGDGFTGPAQKPGAFGDWVATPVPADNLREAVQDTGIRERYIDPRVVRRVEERLTKKVR